MGHFEVEELKHKNELLAHSVDDQFVMGSEHLLEGVQSLFLLADGSHDWHGIQLVKDCSSVSNLLLSALTSLCCHNGIVGLGDNSCCD